MIARFTQTTGGTQRRPLVVCSCASSNGGAAVSRFLRTFAAVGLLIILALHARGDGGPSVRLNGEAAKTIDVAGLTAKDLAAIDKLGFKDDEWHKLLAVY